MGVLPTALGLYELGAAMAPRVSSDGRQLGLTPLWLTDVKFDVSECAGLVIRSIGSCGSGIASVYIELADAKLRDTGACPGIRPRPGIKDAGWRMGEAIGSAGRG